MYTFSNRFAYKIFYYNKSTEWDIFNGDCMIYNKIISISYLLVFTAVIDSVSFMVYGGILKELNTDCCRSGIY